MSNLPALSEATIRARANANSWARGLRYYEEGAVLEGVWRDGVYEARVTGSGYEPYQVRVTFSDSDIVSASCTCPYDWGGDCKHIVAALLYLAHDPEEVEERPSIATVVGELDRDQLVDLIMHLIELHPELAEDVEDLAPSLLESEVAPSDVSGLLPPPTPVELKLLRRQIIADVVGSIRTGYDDWGDEAWYDSDLSAALEPALARIDEYLAAGDVASALVLLKTATEAWDDGAGELDDYSLEYFWGNASDFTFELGEYWAEAFLMADLSPEERQRWIETMEEMVETILGGESLEIALTAVRDGWDAPALVAAMEGNITEQGAWEGEAPLYADELAKIRLRILAQRGQIQEYLNLAQAEGQFLAYLRMLVQQGQSELAVEEAKELVTMPREAQALAQTMLDHGEVEHAFALARRGLDLKKEDSVMRGHDRVELARWLRDQAHRHGQPDLALEAGLRALADASTLDNYLTLQEVAGDRWPAIKPEALQLAEKASIPPGAVDIFLHEGMYDKAIAIVDKTRWFFDIDKVIEAVKEEYPDWAFHQCRQRAEAIMNAGDSKNYDVAAAWLRQGRDILLAAGKQKQWDDYLAGVMEKHHRKYKLMPMLRALQ